VRAYFKRTFTALENPNYRRYFAGQGTSIIGTWMQKVAQAWLVLQLTDSGAVLGLTVALQQAPTLLLTAWSGSLADRFDRRKILLVTQSAAAVPALVLGLLTVFDQVTVWAVFGNAALLGVIEAIDRPVRISFVSDIVPRHQVTNAVSLNNVQQNVGKVIGPAIAGLMIAAFGTGPTFLVNAASFLAMIYGLARIQIVADPARPASLKTNRGRAWDSIPYVRRRPELLAPLLLMTVSGTLAYNWMVVLPLFARETFGQDARATGLMFTAMGVGAVIMGLVVAGWLRATTKVMVVCAAFFAAAMLATAVAPTLLLAYIMLTLLGAASVPFRTVANSIVQLRSEPHMQGRVVALLVLATNGTTAIGGPIVGWFSEHFGARAGLALGGTGTGVAALATYIALRATRARQQPEASGELVRAGGEDIELLAIEDRSPS
jgi:MFS family permease